MAVSIGLFLVISFLVGVLIWRVIDRALYNRFPDRGVPRINIDLNGVSLDEIKGGAKDVKYRGNDLQIYNNGEILEFGGVEVKGRGNGTWVQEKKPYQIKFENKVDMFGMGKARKWYLLANALDGTNLRNDVAFKLGRTLGMEYVLNGVFVELYIGGEYNGLYYLTQAAEIGKNTVNLKNELGILVELDNYYGEREEFHRTGNGDLLIIKDLVSRDNKDLALADFLKNYNSFELAIKEKDYGKITELIDVDSFAKYFLVSEYSVNPDAYWTSFYMYKDGEEDKIHAGPIWDFDLAFGNRKWGNWMGEKFYSPTEAMVRKDELREKEFYEERENLSDYELSLRLSRVIFDLMDLEEFRMDVNDIFSNKMHGRKEEFLNSIYKQANGIRDLAMIDNRKWSNEDYDESVAKLIDWCEQRYDYLEDIYGRSEETAEDE